jgi:cation:H+ antiporter
VRASARVRRASLAGQSGCLLGRGGGGAVLAAADAAIGRDALSSIVARPIVLLQGTLNILLLGMIAMAITSGDLAVIGIGAWSGAILLAYVAAIVLLARSNAPTAWQGD